MYYLTHTQQAPTSFKRTPIDEQAVVQAELYSHLESQTQTIAPEEYTSIEINFYYHQIYANGQLIAHIAYDHNEFVTQRWLVLVNGKEEFRADTWAKSYRHICTHHKDSTLPVQEPEAPAATTGNEIMVQIANECEKHGLELLEDGIYRNDKKLGEAGQDNGNWWFTRTDDATQQGIFCNSAPDAVWLVSRAALPECGDTLDEYLQYRPLEQMPSVELKHLLDSAELTAA